jgi:hypothetical protein
MFIKVLLIKFLEPFIFTIFKKNVIFGHLVDMPQTHTCMHESTIEICWTIYLTSRIFHLWSSSHENPVVPRHWDNRQKNKTLKNYFSETIMAFPRFWNIQCFPLSMLFLPSIIKWRSLSQTRVNMFFIKLQTRPKMRLLSFVYIRWKFILFISNSGGFQINIPEKTKHYDKFWVLISCCYNKWWYQPFKMMEQPIQNTFTTFQHNTIQIQIMVTQ